MNGKFILLLFICMNIVAVSFAYACQTENTQCEGQYDTGVLGLFFAFDDNTDFSESGGLELNPNFSSSISSSITPTSSGVSGTQLAVLLDGLQMVIGFLTLLTPLPMLNFLYSTGIPLFILIIIGFPLVIMWSISILEFVRGASF